MVSILIFLLVKMDFILVNVFRQSYSFLRHIHMLNFRYKWMNKRNESNLLLQGTGHHAASLSQGIQSFRASHTPSVYRGQYRETTEIAYESCGHNYSIFLFCGIITAPRPPSIVRGRPDSLQEPRKYGQFGKSDFCNPIWNKTL